MRDVLGVSEYLKGLQDARMAGWMVSRVGACWHCIQALTLDLRSAGWISAQYGVAREDCRSGEVRL